MANYTNLVHESERIIKLKHTPSFASIRVIRALKFVYVPYARGGWKGELPVVSGRCEV